MKLEPIRARDVDARLDRALLASAAAAGIAASVVARRARPWASATFAGARHHLTLEARRTPTLGGWVAGLAEADLPVRGHLVADVAVDRIEDDGAHAWVTLTVLTIEQ